MSIPRPQENQCSAIKADGTACRALRVKGTDRCWFHLKSDGEHLDKTFSGSLVDQIEHGHFRGLFEDAEGSIESWQPWLAILSGMFGLPMNPEREKIFRKLSGDRTPPSQQVKQAWLIFSRRTGKSWCVSCISIFLCLFKKYPQLRKGERGWVCIISPTRDMSRTIMDYTKSILETVPEFRKMIEKVKTSEILLKNGTGIAVFTANSISVRSRSVIAGIIEESAFLPRDLSANPDVEILNALTPATATIPNSMIIGVSSPYDRSGILHSMWSNYFGINSEDVLVCNGATRDLNPLIPQEWIDSELERDYERNKAELLGLWRDDVSQFFDGDLLDMSIDLNRGNLPPREGVRYTAFVDGASGASSRSADSFTLSVGTKEKNQVIVDGVWEWTPPFSPATVIEEIAGILRQYKIHRVVGDRWATGALSDLFRQNGIMYEESKLTTSELYLESASFFHSGLVRLPDDKKLLRQLRGLERHTRTSGKDQVTHGVGGHDDKSTVACGVICELLLGLHLSINDPEVLARMPQLSGPKDSLEKLTPWKRQELIDQKKVYVMEDGRGRKKYIRASITNYLGQEKEKKDD